MCARLGWTCIPLVVEVYGGWGCEAQECFSRLSKRLAMQVGVGETEALSQMYCLLAVILMRQNARALLLRCARTPHHDYKVYVLLLFVLLFYFVFLKIINYIDITSIHGKHSSSISYYITLN